MTGKEVGRFVLVVKRHSGNQSAIVIGRKDENHHATMVLFGGTNLDSVCADFVDILDHQGKFTVSVTRDCSSVRINNGRFYVDIENNSGDSAYSYCDEWDKFLNGDCHGQGD